MVADLADEGGFNGCAHHKSDMGHHFITRSAVGMVVGTFAGIELKIPNFLLQTQVSAIACTNSSAHMP